MTSKHNTDSRKDKYVTDVVRSREVVNGDVVVIRRGSRLANDEAINKLANGFFRTGRKFCQIVVVDSLDDLLVLDEKAMNGYGWYRRRENGEVSE